MANIVSRELFDLKEIGFPEVPMFGHYRTGKAVGELSVHTHKAFEICYLAKGRQNYTVFGRDHLLRSGDLFMTKPGERHSSGKQPQEKGELYWINVIPPVKGKGFLGLDPGFSREIVRKLDGVREKRFRGSQNVHRIMQNILLRLSMPDTAIGRVDVANSIIGLLLEVIKCGSSPAESNDLSMNSIITYINDHIEEPIRVPELASIMKLSVTWFKTRFKQETGLPPAEYILRLRVARAKEFLEAGRGNVTDAAMKFGFSSSQHFATTFKKLMTRSPSDITKLTGPKTAT